MNLSRRSRPCSLVVLTTCALLTPPLAAQLAPKETPPGRRDAVTVAIDRGLAYLSSAQRPDGSWLSGYGEEGKNTGVAGLCALAFLAAGHTPGRGPYSAVGNSALRFLLSSADNGLLVRERDSSHGPLYEHGIATLALGELVGTVDPRHALSEPLRRTHRAAVDILLRAQETRKVAEHAGGWRYLPTADQADLSVTGWQLLALRAAQDAGVAIPAQNIERAVEFVRRCAHPSGGFVYDPLQSRQPTVAMTGTGVLALQLCGEFASADAQRAAQWLLDNPVGDDTPFYYYSAYYAAQALYQIGGEPWLRWRREHLRDFLQRQGNDGSWKLSRSIHEQQAGPAYATALAILTLSVEDRLLPIYQR